MDRRSTGVPLVALLAATLFALSPWVARPAAAAEELRVAAATTYSLDADDHAVHVTIDVTATNLKPNRTEGNRIVTYYWDRLSFGIQEEASAIRATGAGRPLAVSTKADDGFIGLTVRLANQLTFRETHKLRIQYDLAGGAPRSASQIRVGKAFASFYAWAWGDPSRSSVTIVIPGGFDETVNGSEVRRSSADGVTRLVATAIAKPQEWFVSVDAERPDELTRDPIAVLGGARITVRAWPEDREWRAKVRDLMENGLPVLQRYIGLDWPVAGELGVYEVYTPLLEGYAGVYYTDRDRIEIGEDLDELTIVHEASHAWFNGDLFTERWITEGMADEYAARVLAELDLDADAPDDPDRGDAAALPLNVWVHPGRIEDDETDARETYGYNTSWFVMEQLLGEIGIEGMREVIAAAAEDETAYQGAPAPETVGNRDDWKRFLDLVEEVGGADGAEALFRTWIVEPSETQRLDDRAEARAAYAALVADGDGWEAPWSVRSQLSSWNFERVEAAIEDAETILELGDTIDERAAARGLNPSDRLETAYESATADLKGAEELAAQQLASLDAIDAARAALDRERDPLTALGLWGGEVPETRFAAATRAFEADEQDAAVAEANAAEAIVTGAAEVGKGRAVAVGGAAAGVLLLGGALIVVRRRRRRARAAVMSAAAARTAFPAAGEPYATLAADPAAPVAAAQAQAVSVPEPPAPDEIGVDRTVTPGLEPPREA